ncbi:hypothetical protein [Salegentibacter sediminis]|uniref:hypothetical protein n=1 Tax=Salegentibacter sediminis TaxID=1930251 RepID=UPI0012FF64D4|nr:hypothetical protein [Salegentibacter sediminis]
MKKYLKRNLPDWLFSAMKSIHRNYKLIKHNFHYAKIKFGLLLAGIYFTIFKKTYKNNGLIIHIPFDLTDFQFRGRFALHQYEVEEAQYIDKYLPKDAKVLELGGCLGYVSCLINKKLINKTQQVTLEANPNLIDWIKKNRDENDCSFFVENSIISKETKNVFYLTNCWRQY